ncbi:hypothetical protein [Bernardetia sp.]|uniref:hypothetical protein n=1 Tax=Bernardetia sp. TaxID=1937974 RepID=UPI0025BF908F|nr:hypothetical protein [Bernardetia sp.]
MNETNLTFYIDGTEVIIKPEKVFMEQVYIPIYKPVNQIITGYVIFLDKEDFVNDIQSLLPKVIDEDYFNKIMRNLDTLIKNHITQFGRLLKSDMELYVGEALLVMCGMAEVLNQEVPSESEKPSLFDAICQKFLPHCS